MLLDPVQVLPRRQIPGWAILTRSATAMASMASNGLNASKLTSSVLNHCVFFRGPLPQLSCLEHDPDVGHRVLVVRLVSLVEVNSPFCLVERVANGIYGLVRLSASVTASRISEWTSSVLPCPGKKRKASDSISGDHDPAGWWASSVHSSAPSLPNIFHASKRPKLQMSVSGDSIFPALVPSETNAGTHPGLCAGPNGGAGPLDPSAALVSDYLSAVYLSRSSLALFAKGPLGRARREFSVNPTSDTQQVSSTGLADLASLIRRMIMTSKHMDAKFDDTIPNIVGKTEGKSRAKRSKNGDEVKRRRDGLLEGEDELVRRWWSDRQDHQTSLALGPDGQAHDADSAESLLAAQISKATAELRTRECLAQIVLIFEALALESEAATANANATGESQAGSAGQTDTTDLPNPGCDDESATKKPEKNPRKEKRVDLELAADLLADRLCIWQSLEDPAIPVLKEKPSGVHSPTKSDANGTGEPPDMLRDFCTEVIVPFYIVRLPSIAGAIARKFGWTGSPVKRATRKTKVDHKSKSDKTKSGTGKLARAKTQVDLRQRLEAMKSRELGISRTSSISGSVPVGSRSQSRPPLSRASSVVSTSSAVSRFKAREIDLDAMSAASTARLERRRKIESELRESRTESQPSQTLSQSQSQSQSLSRSTSVRLDSVPGNRADGLQRHHSMTATDPVKRSSQAVSQVLVQATPVKRSRMMPPPPPAAGLSQHPGITATTLSFANPRAPRSSYSYSQPAFPTSPDDHDLDDVFGDPFANNSFSSSSFGGRNSNGAVTVVNDTPAVQRTKPVGDGGRITAVPFAVDATPVSKPRSRPHDDGLGIRRDNGPIGMSLGVNPSVVPDTPSLSASQNRNSERTSKFGAVEAIQFSFAAPTRARPKPSTPDENTIPSASPFTVSKGADVPSPSLFDTPPRRSKSKGRGHRVFVPGDPNARTQTRDTTQGGRETHSPPVGGLLQDFLQIGVPGAESTPEREEDLDMGDDMYKLLGWD